LRARAVEWPDESDCYQQAKLQDDAGGLANAAVLHERIERFTAAAGGDGHAQTAAAG
jgi:hypothetical protein